MRPVKLTAMLLSVLLLCTGCVPTKPAQRQVFAMDTFMSFTAYGKGAEEALAQAEEYIVQLEQDISVTRPDSDIAMLSRAGGTPVQVGGETYDLLTAALSLCEITGGALDITAYPAVRAWGFTTGEHRVPDPEELTALTEKIDYTAIRMEDASRTVTLPQGMAVDLGAVAKGWAGDRLAYMLRQAGIDSASLSLGGNIHTVGSKPDGSPWRVGIQDPNSDQGAVLAVVEAVDAAVVTSGGYERYFEQDGERYWHIIDPDTAAPARSGVVSATIVGPWGVDCDALSTALFVMGAEDAAHFWRAQTLDFEYVLILEDGSLHITQGLEHSFSLADGYTDRKVTVITP